MAIEFYCPGCGKLMRTADDTAGRKGRCPHCNIKVLIPDHSLAATSTASAPTDSQLASQPDSERWKVKGSRTRNGTAPEKSMFTFACGCCQRHVKVSSEAAGKQGQCPHCGSIIQIPSSP